MFEWRPYRSLYLSISLRVVLRGLLGDEQRSQGRQHEGRSETSAAAGGYQGADDVSGLSGQAEEHDLPLRPWNLPDVRRQNERVSDLQENCGEKNITLLAGLQNSPDIDVISFLDVIIRILSMNYTEIIYITPYHTQPT